MMIMMIMSTMMVITVTMVMMNMMDIIMIDNGQRGYLISGFCNIIIRMT